MAALLAASSMYVSLSESVSAVHGRAKFFPQVQRRRLLRLAFRKPFARGAGPLTARGTGLFGVEELARCGMVDSPDGPTVGGSAKGVGAEEGRRPNVTSMPRCNCDECVAKRGGAPERRDAVELRWAEWAGWAARYALPAGDA